MMRAILQRQPSADHGTAGTLTVDGFTCHTLELPWRDNARSLSCIPAGVYECAIVKSPKFGRVYGVANVPGRSAILIHAGNHAGDRKKGMRTDVEGCILLGLSRGNLNHQQVVLQSRAAVEALHRATGDAPFTLEVRDA